MNITVWIDADSCPKLVREFVLKYAENKNLSVIFVANKEIPCSKTNFKMIICPQEQDAADNYIVNNVQENDLVITRDIPLAARLVDKSITKLPSAVLATGLILLSAIAFQCGLILDTIVKANKEKYELNLIKYDENQNEK